MTIRVGINGFGRIGRSVFRILSRRDDIEVVAVNDLYDNADLAYLLKYDTVMRVFDQDVSTDEHSMTVGGRRVAMTAQRDPAKIPWKDLGAEIVIESTGVLTTRDKLEKHLAAGARRVVLTVPPKDEIDAMVVMGVNDDTLRPQDRLVSNASCTTNCLAPIAKILDETFGIEQGMMTTVHAYTNDQRLADVPHKDLRRSRAAAENIIPTTTGAARAVGKVLPRLQGKLDGMAIRVPVPDGSVVDLACRLSKPASANEINDAVRAAASGFCGESWNTARSRSSRPTSSGIRIPRFSTLSRRRRPGTVSRKSSRGTTTSGDTRTASSISSFDSRPSALLRRSAFRLQEDRCQKRRDSQQDDRLPESHERPRAAFGPPALAHHFDRRRDRKSREPRGSTPRLRSETPPLRLRLLVEAFRVTARLRQSAAHLPAGLFPNPFPLAHRASRARPAHRAFNASRVNFQRSRVSPILYFANFSPLTNSTGTSSP